MKITHEFSVNRPIGEVWEAFQDVPAMARCLPGAELTEDKGGGAFAGALSVKLGPMSSKFEGEAHVTTDAAAHTSHIEGKGIDRSGGSRGQATIDYSMAPTGEATLVTVDADLTLSGAIAQFGRSGLVEEVSKRLVGEFVECLEGKLSAATPEEAARVEAAEVKGLSLIVASLLSWIGGFFKRLLGRDEED